MQDIEKARQNRDRVALWLTPRELAKAQHLALEWLPKEPQYDPAPEDIKIRTAELQRDLRQLGYDPGPVDGILGAKTRAAVRALQADHGLPITGEISGNERIVISLELTAAAARATGEPPAPTPGLIRHTLARESSGTGFRVSAQGHVLTNAHVVRGCTEVRIPPTGVVEVMAREDSSDLALLRAPAGATRAVAKFRQGRGIRPGASVVVVGYPLRGLLASEANVSTGAVSALAGPGDDRRLIQITAPVQTGNSGGPVLDAAGNVVGVVVATLDAIRIARSTGDIPQNVNFAVSAGTARAFLDAEGVPYETAPSDPALAPAEVAAAARKFTVLVECWK